MGQWRIPASPLKSAWKESDSTVEKDRGKVFAQLGDEYKRLDRAALVDC